MNTGDPYDGLTSAEVHRFELLSGKTVRSLSASEASELAELLKKRLAALEQRESVDVTVQNKYRAVLRILSASSTGAAVGASAGILGWGLLGFVLFPGIGTITGALIGATVGTLLKSDSDE